MSGDAGDWVRESTPRDADATWAEEQSDYGTAVSPEEWDDYSVEQSVPVVPPHPQPEDAGGTAAEVVELGDGAAVGWEHRDAPAVVNDQAAAEDLPAGQVAEDIKESTSDAVAGGVGANEDSADQAHAVAEPVTEPVAPVTEPFAAAPEHVETADLPSEENAVDEGFPAGERGEEFATDPIVDEPAIADTATQVSAPADEAVVVEETAMADELEATQVRPVVAPGVAAGAAGAAGLGAGVAAAASAPALPEGLYRHTTDEDTAVLPAPVVTGYPDADQQEAEERRLREQLEAERQARNQRLGVVDTSAANEIRDREGFVPLNTDKFFPSFGLFVLRLITAGILGIAGYRILMAIPDTAAKFEPTVIPEPRLVAWILGFTLGSLALLLVIGMLQRFVGFVLVAIAAASLVFLRWGNFNVFSATWEGFPLLGDKELLLAGIGLLLLTMGGGSWGVDGAFRRSRANAKAEKVG